MPIQSLQIKRRKLQGEGTSAEGGSHAAHPAAHMTATNFPPVNPSVTPTEKLPVDAPTIGSDSATLPIIPKSIAEPFVPISLAMASPLNVPHPDEPINLGSSAEPSSFRTEEEPSPLTHHFVQGSPLAPFFISDIRLRGPLPNLTANLLDQGPNWSLGLPEPQYRDWQMGNLMPKIMTNPADKAEFRKMPRSAPLGHFRNSLYSLVAEGQYLSEPTNEQVASKECQARLAEVQQEKEDLLTSVNELEQHKKSLQENLQQMSELHEKKQVALEARLAEAQQEKQELTEQHKKSLQENLQWMSKLHEKKHLALEARLAEAQREKEELTGSVSVLEQEKRELAATVERLTQESSFGVKEVLSRDGQMKLQAQVFFASIDQRSESAAGASACAVLVAVIANWLQSNQSKLPIKSEFDSLIRDGSLEWRNLCKNEDYKQSFPDKHFDLDTILKAGIVPLSVVHQKSFIGFFHSEGLEGSDFEILHGETSFDAIWHEISRCATNCPNGESLVYIVSWNDHFFVLKVEQDAYYIIDTLGERLYEGCNQAYILKFDRDTTIKRLPKETRAASYKKSAWQKVKPSNSKGKKPAKTEFEAGKNEMMEEEIVCKGKESCKEYLNSFLAAIPIRDLSGEFKKGVIALERVFHGLQIDFFYTQPTQSAVESS